MSRPFDHRHSSRFRKFQAASPASSPVALESPLLADDGEMCLCEGLPPDLEHLDSLASPLPVLDERQGWCAGKARRRVLFRVLPAVFVLAGLALAVYTLVLYAQCHEHSADKTAVMTLDPTVVRVFNVTTTRAKVIVKGEGLLDRLEVRSVARSYSEQHAASFLPSVTVVGHTVLVVEPEASRRTRACVEVEIVITVCSTCSTPVFHIRTHSGDVNFGAGAMVDSAVVTTVSGNIATHACVVRQLNVTTTSGSASVDVFGTMGVLVRTAKGSVTFTSKPPAQVGTFTLVAFTGQFDLQSARAPDVAGRRAVVSSRSSSRAVGSVGSAGENVLFCVAGRGLCSLVANAF